MATTAVSDAVTAITGALSSLSPNQVFQLGGHLTQSNEAKAMGYLSAMLLNPAGAGVYVAPLAAIPNLPPQVETYVAAALSDPAGFKQNIMNAQIEVQKALGTGILGSLGL